MKIYILIFLIILQGCSRNKQNNEISKFVKAKLGAELILPEMVTENISYVECNIKNDSKGILRIVTYIDGDCSICMEELKKWQELGVTFLDKSEVDLLFYIYSRNKEQLIYNLKLLDFNYDFRIDPNDCFIKQNQIPLNKNFNTFLIDQNNKIILIGNPIINKNVEDTYYHYIFENK